MHNRKFGGRIRVAVGSMRLVPDDLEAGDIIFLDRLPVLAVPVSIMLWNDQLDAGHPRSTLTFDVGIHIPSEVAKDIDAFASAMTTFQSANRSGIEVLGAAGSAIERIGSRLWAWAGDPSDPGGEYAITISILTAAANAVPGTLSYRIEYVLN